MFASLINENANKPLKVFRLIPSEDWCYSLQRFFHQIKRQPSFISGKKLFVISRQTLFTLAGILVIYVLVLLQLVVADED